MLNKNVLDAEAACGTFKQQNLKRDRTEESHFYFFSLMDQNFAVSLHR